MVSNRGVFQALAAVAVTFLAYTYYMHFDLGSGTLPYKIVKIPGCDTGVVAARDILQGEVIMKEEPLFVVNAGTFGTDLGGHVKKVIHQKLNSTQRSSFLELSHPLKAGHSDIPEAIFQVNSLKVGDDAAGIFLTMARINHGCGRSFNSVYSWRDKEGFGVIHALKPIRKGQEILREYLDTKMSRQRRQEQLLEVYAFDCSCDVCSQSQGDSERSDAGLSSMKTIHQKFLRWEDDLDMNGAEAVRLAKRVWALGEKQGYWAGRGKLAEDVVKVAAAHQDEKSARLWAELSSEWYSYELGFDSEDVERMMQIILNPTKHSAWATREELWVGGPDMVLL